MPIPELAITLAGPLLILAGILLLFDLYRISSAPASISAQYVSRSVIAVAALVLAPYLILTLAFAGDLFSVREIFIYSSSSLPLAYKLGGPFIGSNGSLLFITALFIMVYAAFRAGRRADTTAFRTAAYRILDIIAIFFILVTLVESPFETVSGIIPEGAGLNPLLQTPWVLLHPPVIFLGYVFVFFAFALMLARMVTEKDSVQEGERALRLSLYAAWLFLTLGISLGGVWSYEVLGWGGYWSWDPVETASLLPWLALTAYFHVPYQGQGTLKRFPLLLTPLMVLFATALTRGGFTESLHAFGESPAGLMFLGFALITVLYFFLVVRSRKYSLPSLKIDTSSLSSISLVGAYLSLVMLLIICFLGAAAPAIVSLFTHAPMALDGNFYNLWCYPFTLAFVAALIGCNARMRVRSYAVVLATVLILGGVLAIMGIPTPNPLTNLALPLLFATAIIVVDAGAQALLKKKASPRSVGRILVHLAIVVILIGVAITSASAVESTNILVKPNATIDVLGVRMQLSEPVMHTGRGRAYYADLARVGPEASAMEMPVVVQWEGGIQEGFLWMYYYPIHGVMSEPLILSTPTRDLYISMHYTDTSYTALKHALVGEESMPEDLILVVKRVPLVGLIWAGIVLLVIGMAILILGEVLSSRQRG